MSKEDREDNRSLFASFAWQQSALGDPASWPPDMRAVIRTILASQFPVCTLWGEAGIQIYNTAYNHIYGHKHPASFGRPVAESWPEIWAFLGPALEEVRASRQALWFENTLLPLRRQGEPEECYFDFSFSPICDSDGTILGIMSVATEKTVEVVSRRRQAIRALDAAVSGDRPFEVLCDRLLELLKLNQADCAAAAMYRPDESGMPASSEIWRVRCDAEFAAFGRGMALAAAARHSVVPLDLGPLADGRDLPEAGCVLPFRSRGGRLQGVLLLVPDRLVPLQRSFLQFAQALFGRFHAALHTAEARQEELGQARDERAEQEAMYRFLFDNMQDGAVYCATEGGADAEEIVLAANPGACRMLGYHPEEVVGRSRTEFVFPDDRVLETALQRRERERSFLGELTLRRKDDSPVQVEVMSSLVPLRSGEIRSLTILRDIAHRADLERQRADRARLETLATLTGGLAQDFNNLLTVIIGSLDTLRHELPLTGPQQELASRALLSAERAGRLTNQLLSYARQQTLVSQPIDLAAFLSELQPLMETSLGEINRMTVDAEADLPPCLADPAQLTTVLLNLVTNARDAMPGGGHLSLRLSRVSADSLPGAADRHDLAPGEYLGLQVADTGTGIAAEHRGRIFEPFFSTKQLEMGTGLGLSMVQGFMRQIGGDIRLDPGVAAGASFLLAFPVAERPPAVPSAKPVRQTASGQRVLVVEDNELVREQTRTMLRLAGFHVETATDASDALSQLAQGLAVDLVLTDQVMPGDMSGMDLALELRRRCGAIPVAIMTGHDAEGTLGAARAHGIEVIRKPFTRWLLAEILLQMLD